MSADVHATPNPIKLSCVLDVYFGADRATTITNCSSFWTDMSYFPNA